MGGGGGGEIEGGKIEEKGGEGDKIEGDKIDTRMGECPLPTTPEYTLHTDFCAQKRTGFHP